MERSLILLLSPADTDLLTARAANRQLSTEVPHFLDLQLNDYQEPEALERLFAALAIRPVAVVLRLLGGKPAFPRGFEWLKARCEADGVAFLPLPGDPQPDPELSAEGSLPLRISGVVFDYLIRGGVVNCVHLAAFLSDVCRGTTLNPPLPQDLPWEGVYHPAVPAAEETEKWLQRRHDPQAPTVGILFYRAQWMSGDLAFVDALVQALEERGCNALPAFSFTLRDDVSAADGLPPVIRRYLLDADGRPRVDVLINTLSFSSARVLVDDGPTRASGLTLDAFERLDLPVLQGLLVASSRQQWDASNLGLAPQDAAMKVVLPEFDGRIIGLPIAFKEEAIDDSSEVHGLGIEPDASAAPAAIPSPHASLLGAPRLYRPDLERTGRLAAIAARLARLKHTSTAEKRVALVLSNYPSKHARIGNAVALDTPASLIKILQALRDAGFTVGDFPEDGDQLVHALIDRCGQDVEYLTEAQMRDAVGQVPATTYQAWFATLPDRVQTAMQGAWGPPPGTVMCWGDALVMPGLQYGNVFVGVQPARGYGDNPVAIYHSPDLAPTHHYVAFYRWLQEIFQAHAIIHVGKHGNLEWLPGKAMALSESCYPDLTLGELPLIYPFVINDPGEGMQAKRRAHAVIVDHLIPIMTTADSYNELAKLEQLMDEYVRVQTLDPSKLPILEAQIWQLVEETRMNHDLHVSERPDDFAVFLQHIDGYLCELKDSQIRDGLHTLGQVPTDENRLNLLLALTRLDNGPVPSLRRAIAEAVGLEYDPLLIDRGQPVSNVPEILQRFADGGPLRTRGDLLEAVHRAARALLQAFEAAQGQPAGIDGVISDILGQPHPGVARVLEFVHATLDPALRRTSDEVHHILRALDGGFIPPGPSGAPTRGSASILPTGRNFYSVDVKTIPSPAAWDVGRRLADDLLRRYLREEGAYPQSVGMVVWGTSTMRTQGDDIGEILYLLGVRPRWQAESRRIVGLERIPLAELGRPRIDVTVRISGFFRDAFPNLVAMLDEAVMLAAEAEEDPVDDNYVRQHFLRDREARQRQGMNATESRRHALYRVFGSKPGTYGVGMLHLMDQRNWQTDEDLARVYITWSGYAYTGADSGVEATSTFAERLKEVSIAVKNQDNREHDIFDSDDYFQEHGGMIACVRALTGRNPLAYFGDSANPDLPTVRTLGEEAARVFRSRVVNPKWIHSVMRHGYKGAFEMAATIDYLFGYDATAQVVQDWMYEGVTHAYLEDPDVRRFLEEKNPWALKSMAERLLEAIQRGLWEEPSEQMTHVLQQLILDTDELLEGRSEPESAP
jgi:cobaltochelatase CobN